MKVIMSFLLVSGFCFKSPGQAKNPERKIRCSYESNQMKDITVRFLDFWAFPWGVCIPRDNHNLTQQAITWTWQAMELWNKSYREYMDKYKYRVLFPGKPEPEGFTERYYKNFKDSWLESVDRYLNSHKVYDVPDPDDKLFVWSCDRSRYNIIYPQFGSLKPGYLGIYDAIDTAEEYFYGRIIMSDKENWNRNSFINVMMHELGHALGIPHLKATQTDLIRSDGYGCDEYDEICKLRNDDFRAFLSLYDKPRIEKKSPPEAPWVYRECIRTHSGKDSPCRPGWCTSHQGGGIECTVIRR